MVLASLAIRTGSTRRRATNTGSTTVMSTVRATAPRLAFRMRWLSLWICSISVKTVIANATGHAGWVAGQDIDVAKYLLPGAGGKKMNNKVRMLISASSLL